MPNPNGHFQPQGLPNQFAPKPVSQMAWGFLEATAEGERKIVLVMMTPHSQVNYWFSTDDFKTFVEQCRAQLVGLHVPPPGSSSPL